MKKKQPEVRAASDADPAAEAFASKPAADVEAEDEDETAKPAPSGGVLTGNPAAFAPRVNPPKETDVPKPVAADPAPTSPQTPKSYPTGQKLAKGRIVMVHDPRNGELTGIVIAAHTQERCAVFAIHPHGGTEIFRDLGHAEFKVNEKTGKTERVGNVSHTTWSWPSRD